MRGSSSPRDVAHVYEDVGHAADAQPPHRLDVVEAAAWPRPRPVLTPRPAPAPATGDRVVRHRLEAPTRIGFGLGFGFAAGVWTFRAATTLIAGVALLVAIWHLLSMVLR